ncbi:hypothetical protein GHT06_004520 [Daphnia sinensis]|uniref:Tyr recombinase domain-containing protein n=1 Tax=Daphnia sinensis TaxID=1820382 RepID=A0AAD5KVW9_9CRUS|nr:hypothetical protein GHT06_004520 [Daphnia sinensis]
MDATVLVSVSNPEEDISFSDRSIQPGQRSFDRREANHVSETQQFLGISFRSRCANMSAEGSSSESSSDSSSTSASDSSRGGGVKKFQFSSAKSTSLAGWAVSGLDDARAKSAREAFRPKLKKNADLLINPNLDEAFYIRLKTVKSSSATKANIDPIEKIYRNQTFKILDLVKPIMFLASRTRKKKKSRADAKAVKTALKLWAVLYHDITNARRRNILAQIYPQNIGLLDDKAILPAGGEHLFGPKFTQALVEQVKTLNALENAGGAPCPSGSNSGQRQSNRGFSQPPSASFSGGRYSNFNGSRYVQTILAFDGSFGGRIARFAVEWSKMTLDPWILSTVSQGLHLDFISEPVQFTIQPNACMDAVQHDCCEQESEARQTVQRVRSLLEALGFVISDEKSAEEPSQGLEYIGLFIDSVKMRLILPDRKRLDILRLCKSALKKPQISRIDLEKIIGNLNWAAAAVNFAPAHFRGLQILLNSRPEGRLIRSREAFTFSEEARKDLSWWLSEADFTSGRPLIFPAPDLSIASDASLSGWGAVCKEIRTGGPWTKDEGKEHINFLELLAAFKALQCFTETARDTTTSVVGGLETGSAGIHIDSGSVGGKSGPFCELLERSTSDFCKPVSATGSLEHRRSFTELEGSRRILFSPLQLNSLLSNEDSTGTSGDCPSNALLAQPMLVPVLDGASDGHAAPSLPIQVVADFPVGGGSSTDRGRVHQINRLAALRSCLEERGFPQKVIELILGATRSTTHSAYQSAWVAWISWCFLSDYFHSGKSYSTVNVARSMLSSTLSLSSESLELGRNPLVVNLMRGVYNEKPPVPKYTATWDPSVVLMHLEVSANARNSLSTLQLARKASTLLALTSLSRCADLAAIQLRSINFSEGGVKFALNRPRKAQHSGPLHVLSIGAWHQKPAICPVACMRSYIVHTAPFRNDSNSESLFIGSNKPHKPVTSSTIGRWIKEQLKEAGIDTSIFSAHSARGAAASKAMDRGVPIQSILNLGHWSRESTFARFYKRTVPENTNLVGASILCSSQDPDEPQI